MTARGRYSDDDGGDGYGDGDGDGDDDDDDDDDDGYDYVDDDDDGDGDDDVYGDGDGDGGVMTARDAAGRGRDGVQGHAAHLAAREAQLGARLLPGDDCLRQRLLCVVSTLLLAAAGWLL